MRIALSQCVVCVCVGEREEEREGEEEKETKHNCVQGLYNLVSGLPVFIADDLPAMA